MKLTTLLESKFLSRKGYIAVDSADYEEVIGDLHIEDFRGLFAFRNQDQAEHFILKFFAYKKPGDSNVGYISKPCRFDMVLKPWVVALTKDKWSDSIYNRLNFICVGNSEEEIRDDYEDELKEYEKVVFLKLDDPDEEFK